MARAAVVRAAAAAMAAGEMVGEGMGVVVRVGARAAGKVLDAQ